MAKADTLAHDLAFGVVKMALGVKEMEAAFKRLGELALEDGRAGFPDALAAFKKNRSDFSGNNQINSESRKEPK